jgi:hypothetical protein
MNIGSEKLLLRSIASAHAGQRNVGNFSKKERAQLLIAVGQGNVHTYHDDRRWQWARLTEVGLQRLYKLNGLKDI